jgi:hypothetical protein
VSAHISLAFLAAAPKLSAGSVRQLLDAHLGQLDPDRMDRFIEALNGQGNCAQVIGAVESLIEEGNTTVHGIVDWDLGSNKSTHNVHVLAASQFYAIENAILNPLTLGLYLLHNYSDKVEARDFGLPVGYDPIALYSEVTLWHLSPTVSLEKSCRTIRSPMTSSVRSSLGQQYVLTVDMFI